MNDPKSQHDKKWFSRQSSPRAFEVGDLSTVVTASAAILCATLARYLASRQAEVYSEIICWLLLPTLLYITQTEDSPRTITPPNSAARRPISWNFMWIVALGITLATLYRAEIGDIKLYVKNAYHDMLGTQTDKIYSHY